MKKIKANEKDGGKIVENRIKFSYFGFKTIKNVICCELLKYCTFWKKCKIKEEYSWIGLGNQK